MPQDAEKLPRAEGVTLMASRSTRTSLSPALRDKLLVQVGHRCVRCLSDVPEVDAHHILPVSEGGDDSESNLVVLCPTCHRLVHRYKLSARQLRAYKKQAILKRNNHLFYKSGGQDGMDGIASAEDLIGELQKHVEGWYNQLIKTRAITRKATADAEDAEFAYVHSRHYLPHVLAIRGVLENQDKFAGIVADVDVYLSILTSLGYRRKLDPRY